MSLYIDLSEFLTNQITTGIQRIAGEMCRYLPPNTAIPVRVHAGGYVALPPALIETIGGYFRDPSSSGAAEIRRLGNGEAGSAIHVSAGDTVLVPEVFDNPERLDLFRGMPEAEFQRIRFIVYDLLPMTHPQYFTPDGVLAIYRYYQVIRGAGYCGFISEYTRDTYYDRLKRTSARDGIVLPLGCDSLGTRPEQPALNRALTFTVLGTIEPRKNHELILEAFEPLLRNIPGLQLEFVGKMGWVNPAFSQKVHALAGDKDSGLRFYSAPGDGAIRRCIEQCRATIYVSAAEGYGLPPVESLWVGTPVIASTNVPSLKGLGSLGIRLVEPLTVRNLREAVLAFVESKYANQKIEETMRLNLPTWRSFTEDILDWCDARTNGA